MFSTVSPVIISHYVNMMKPNQERHPDSHRHTHALGCVQVQRYVDGDERQLSHEWMEEIQSLVLGEIRMIADATMLLGGEIINTSCALAVDEVKNLRRSITMTGAADGTELNEQRLIGWIYSLRQC